MVSKKAEKRLTRKNLKLEKTLEKTVRQCADPILFSKTPISASASPSRTIPDTPLTETKTRMKYSCDHQDCVGIWSWRQSRDWGKETWNKKLKPYLTAYEEKTWGEIALEKVNARGGKRKPKHCFYDKGTIAKEAMDRLIEIEKDDLEEFIFRFRLNGKNRLYGFRISAIFYLLWWDPEHKICPCERN